MYYSSLCRNFLTTAPVLFILESDVHQNTDEKENYLSNVVFCFDPFKDIDKDKIVAEFGSKGDSIMKNKKRSKSKSPCEHELHLETDNDRSFFDYPFLLDRNTCMYLRKPDTKVMFIMRGLPGSGKSTIVQKIKSLYSHCFVCSADDYFCDSDGVYHFDQNLLGAAHTNCQNRAQHACQQGVPIIVIDNTNVKRWEMKFYSNLANTSGYIVVTVQPKTPWKMDPMQLALRNKHGVTVDILKKKVQMFDDVIPAYYAWFLDEKKSHCLIKLAAKIFLQCIILFSDLKNCLLNELSIKPENISDEMASEILSTYYTHSSKKSALLHCTSRYCGSGKAAGSLEYHRRSDVQNACGQVFDLHVTGLIITKRTMGARVTLSPSAVPLFKNAAEEEWKEARYSPSNKRKNEKLGKVKGKKCVQLKKSAHKNQKIVFNENSNSDKTLQCLNTFLTILNKKFPLLTVSGATRNAHFTLKTFSGVESKEVNMDILDICHIESTKVCDLPKFLPVYGGQACYFGDGVCCVYFDKALRVKTLFSGYY
ncbi:hypothetical protein Btru_007462 [Bulinus truncatus]|nr:hypothetical protein Btru_007462 [Bulinus truncatus]